MNAIQQIFPTVQTSLDTAPPSLEDTLMAVLDAVKVLGLSQFQIGNRPVVSLPAVTASAAAPPVTARLSEALWPALYDAAYARPFSLDAPAAFAAPAGLDLLSQLRAVFPEGYRWSYQWQVYKTDANGSVHARKGDCCRHQQPGTFALTTPGPLQANAMVSILLPLASSQWQSGFYHITGHTPHSDHDDAALARLYLNTRPATVASLMAQIAGILNTHAVPFRAKTLLEPGAYDRTDSTVIYLARRHLPFALALLRDFFTDAIPDLEPDVPLFSKSLTGGIGGADDPGYGMSFGQTRAMLMADAIVSAWAAGSQTAQIRFDYLKRRFDSSGLILAAPHLSAGNSDIYAFPA